MGWSRTSEIHVWWKSLPAEKYWLDVTGRDDLGGVLAAPCGESKRSTSWAHELIQHVRDGDRVFRYRHGERAIVACSVADGPVREKQLPWPAGGASRGHGKAGERLRPSRVIALRRIAEVDPAVSLDDIARTQWNLFPELRALEDKVGAPLYYPFEMGSQEKARPLAGYVFKLPAIFVRSFPDLARAAGLVEPAPVRRLHVPAESGAIASSEKAYG